MTQILSSDITPTAPEGTAERKKQMSDIIGMQDMVSKAALGM